MLKIAYCYKNDDGNIFKESVSIQQFLTLDVNLTKIVAWSIREVTADGVRELEKWNLPGFEHLLP